MAKTARAKGLAYTSVKTGKPMPAAKVGSPCRCPKKCFDVLGKENIATVFKAYYDIGDNYTAKSAYLNGQIRPRTTKRRRQRNRDIPTRLKLPRSSKIERHILLAHLLLTREVVGHQLRRSWVLNYSTSMST